MYGTIAKIHTNPAQVDALRALAERMGTAPGQLGRYVFQMDADPGELFLVAVFESRQAYWDNAQSPEQHQRCLLYTSDAADERSSVDLGGRRIIKKKKH